MSLFHGLLDLIAPPACLACRGEWFPEPVCPSCRDQIDWQGLVDSPEPVQVAWALGVYQGLLRRVVLSAKFDKRAGLARGWGRVLAEEFPELDVDLVVPVPLVWHRFLARGFNQATELARPLARRFGVPLADVLIRTGFRRPASRLRSAKERQDAAVGTVRVRRWARLDLQRVLLVDDVLTTGATAAECARALKRAGAHTVDLAVLAWTPKSALGGPGGPPSP